MLDELDKLSSALPFLAFGQGPWCFEWMNGLQPPTAFADLSMVLGNVRAAVASWGARKLLEQALLFLVYRRLGEIAGRITRLAQRLDVGRLRRRTRLGRDRALVVEPASGDVPKPLRTARIWPRQEAWLIRMVGWEAGGYGGQIGEILKRPEMVALLVAAPQTARILRPLCRMLMVDPRLLRPRVAEDLEVAAVAIVPAISVAKPERVRAQWEPVDWGRIPLPRGVLPAARRGGFKPVR